MLDSCEIFCILSCVIVENDSVEPLGIAEVVSIGEEPVPKLLVAMVIELCAREPKEVADEMLWVAEFVDVSSALK